MEVTVSKIGNSYGIILPKALMNRLSLHKADILVVDEDSSDLLMKKKGPEYMYEGPNAGFFAPLASMIGNEEIFGGDVPSEDYVSSLREGAVEDDIIESLL